MTQVGTACSEQPVLMGGHNLFGIVTAPTASRRQCGFILLNSGLLHRVGPSLLYVSLGRQLAELGFVTARIDASGKGDTPRRQNVTAEHSLLLDYDDVCKTLAALYGLQKFILVGLCSGADDAYAVASARDNVAGLVLLDGYAAKTTRFHVRHYGRQLLRAEAWWALFRRLFRLAPGRSGVDDDEADRSYAEIRQFPTPKEAMRKFDHISKHCERCLCIYTSACRRYYNYEGQLGHRFPGFKPSGGLREIYFPAAKHTFPLVHHRRIAIKSICDWAADFG
ncbi:MAG: hypothetical protein ACREQ8_09980 [Woeseiaceae bacterium]